MKYLKIKDNKGYYKIAESYKEIDQINKDDLLSLLDKADENDFELEPYDENLIGNKAHQIIYKNIYNKFVQFLKDKEQFKRDVDKLYKDAIIKYSVENNSEDLGENDTLD